MSYATYVGSRGELSVTLPIPKDGVQVRPWPHRWDAGQTARNECVVLEPGQPRRVSRWAGVWLAGARQRWGPWVKVSLEPGEWRACQAQAPWLGKARDLCVITHPEVLRRFLEQELLPLDVLE